MQPLKGKIALVTGATKQVGRGVAVGLAEAGAKVYVTGRYMTRRRYGRKNPWGTLKQTVKEIEDVGGTGVPIVCDHTKDHQTRAVFDQIEQDEGRLDILTWFVGRLYSENVAYGVSHAALDRMAADMAIELKPHEVAMVSLSPMGIVEDTQWNVKDAESARFIGRVVTALYEDEHLMSKSGQVLGTRILAKTYGITDDNGKRPRIIPKYRHRLKAYPEWNA